MDETNFQDKACDHYYRYKYDIKLMSEMGWGIYPKGLYDLDFGIRV